MPAPSAATAGSALNGPQPGLIHDNALDDLCANAELKILEHFGKPITVNEVDWRCSLAGGLLGSVSCESSCSYQQPFVSTANHGPTEVADLAGRHSALVPLALEDNVEAQDASHSCNPFAVDAAVT